MLESDMINGGKLLPNDPSPEPHQSNRMNLAPEQGIAVSIRQMLQLEDRLIGVEGETGKEEIVRRLREEILATKLRLAEYQDALRSARS